MVWMQYDPAEELAKVTVPGLIIQGGHDCQIPPENGERLIRTAPDNQYAEIATMNHVLKATPADCAAAIGSYNNPALPLHPELVPAITRFLSAR
ncbi:3-oxoadipate enol-lactonase [Klebsiella pneumoniae]|nr:3-oxoadipate enol-lactonase [Klebsiella pneumoniae]